MLNRSTIKFVTKIFAMLRSLLLWLLFFSTTLVAQAQQLVFSTQVSAEKIGIKDQLQVDYTLQNAQQIESLSPPN
jgi:hypothetical protein